MVVVVGGPNSEKLGSAIAKKLNLQYINLESKVFPDDESYLKFSEEFSEDALIVIQSCFPKQDKRLMELFFILDTAKEFGVKNLNVVIPYLPYARQDKRFRAGEVVSNKSIGNLLYNIGTDLLLTIDVHQKVSLKEFKMRSISISAMPLIAEHLKSMNLSDPCIIAPDIGATSHAETISSILKTDCTFFEKKRDRITGKVDTVKKDLDFRGKDIVIIDDMISTGGTIANVSKIAKDCGAEKIIAACTHALLVGNAEEKMRNSGITDIVTTDTVPNRFCKIFVAPIITDTLRKCIEL
ncbi:ribose-phosphate diphosphokinase [[Eubacterium] cellulosolvens]